METKHTPGPWRIGTPGPNGCYTVGTENGLMVAMVAHSANQLDQCEQAIGDARLIAAAPTQHAEMLRYLPIIERAEAEPELWARLTAGTGIATANGYRAAIAKAEGR